MIRLKISKAASNTKKLYFIDEMASIKKVQQNQIFLIIYNMMNLPISSFCYIMTILLELGQHWVR